ncbi:site-specific integrase [Muricauda oceani]|uniref:Site-specific integrase n=1 Tax=Flagellimonas oceani TaxID=2698672 RepID=A0A6G7J2W5_9FLAO|nr:site-specific integrase [Allomuricauda oceani]MBW8244033.1 site-specific integrase [Allomuricauda oceani]QII45010.1 site-specific integrase [Allomuricauda oceani]
MQKNNRLTINFFTRKHKVQSENRIVYCRITIDGERTDFSINREIKANLWDNNRKRGKGFSSYVISLNKYLDQIYTGLHEAHRLMMAEEKVITPLYIKARFFGEDEGGKTLKQLIAYHNGTMHTSLRPGTRKNYHITERCVGLFLKEEYGMEDIKLKKLNYRFISDFEQYLRKYRPSTRTKCTNNGAMKHMERLKKMSRLAVRLDWITKDPFENYKLRFEKTEREYLTKRELRLIEETTFTKEGVEKCKNVFLFSCYTGLSYIDLKALTPDHVLKGIDGNDWLFTKRIKTDEKLKIPLLPQAKDIIKKYEDSAERRITKVLLPVYSNQKVNYYLKEICKACGINKKVTFHTARHTFATTVTLSNGVPIETVSKMLGHTKLTTTQIYARVLEKKVGEDMRKLVETMGDK